MVIRLKDGFILRKIAGQYMAVPVGGRTQEIHGMVALNETGAFLWEKLGTVSSSEALVEELLKEYEVDRETAEASVLRFAETLKNESLLEDTED